MLASQVCGQSAHVHTPQSKHHPKARLRVPVKKPK